MTRLTRSATMLVALLAVGATALTASAQDAKKSCTDTMPKECEKVKFLGEQDDCACFVCNPGEKTRKVVCTKDAETKKALYKLRDEAAKAAEAGGTNGDKPASK